MERKQILVVEDVEINREILVGMFDDEYEILEASNGEEGIVQIEKAERLVLILLDIVMPVMDGFGVLDYMKEKGLIDRIPVILITSEAPKDSENRAYSYGIADVIHKPFYPEIVKKRAKNIIELYQDKLHMEERIREQTQIIIEQTKKVRQKNEFMIDALSSVVEFRSLESGNHIRRVKYLTRILLKYLVKHFPKYGLTQEDVDEISRASALHDIGKIGIPDAILLKPGKLTPEEFEVMKTHTTVGCQILESFHKMYDDKFYRYCYEVCRHHHERWDGKGYPDKLVGSDIPISAQVVSIVDVYDALISERVYKGAYSTAEAYKMIMDGECGTFAPDILECFSLAKEDFFNVIEVIQMFEFD